MPQESKLLICSHHKSGATFTVQLFRKLSSELGKRVWYKFYDPVRPKADDWDICIHQHGRIDDILLDQSFRGWRSIRHPMALIYSATLYHQRCKEPWVDVPLERFDSDVFWSATDGALYNIIKDPRTDPEKRKDIMNAKYVCAASERRIAFDSGYNLNGATYRDFLSSFKHIEDKILFEMRAYSQGVINEMVRFPADSRFCNIQLEAASFDPTMTQLHGAFKHLGFQGDDLLTSLRIAKEQCLWARNPENLPAHSTTGVSDDWKTYFKGDVLAEFRRLFGWAEEALGYDSP